MGSDLIKMANSMRFMNKPDMTRKTLFLSPMPSVKDYDSLRVGSGHKNDVISPVFYLGKSFVIVTLGTFNSARSESLQ